MFDIGVNLTSSQFAKDRDDVVARAFDAELMATHHRH
ncbi:DNase TatD [Escherichia coli]|nr:DNase TatD [Escherichia coli]